MHRKLYILLLLASLQSEAQKPIDFFVLLGQSNMAGRAKIRDVDTLALENVLLVNSDYVLEHAKNPLNKYSTIRKDDIKIQRLGPGYYFGKELAKHKNETIALMVNARGASEISRWLRGSAHVYYEATLNRINKALLKNPQLRLKGVLWQQGESDRFKSKIYLGKLKRFISDLRIDLGKPNLPFYVGEMGKWNKGYDLVRTELLKIEGELHNVFIINSDGLTNFDVHHFDSKSQEILGKRYAGKCLSLKSEMAKLPTKTERIVKNLKTKGGKAFVVAHRGDWRNAPENSLQAIENAIQMGVDMVEVDVHLSKDSVPILIHDAMLDRTTTGSGPVGERSMEALEQLFLRNAIGVPTKNKIPSLAQALELSKGRVLLDLDVKDNVPFHQIAEVLTRHSAYGEVVTRSYRNYQEAREYYGESLQKLLYFPNISSAINDIGAYISEFENSIDPFVYVPKFETEESKVVPFLKTIKNNGDRIWVHTITADRSGGHDDETALFDIEGSYGWLLDNGVSVFQTDRPNLLIDFLRGKGLHQ